MAAGLLPVKINLSKLVPAKLQLPLASNNSPPFSMQELQKPTLLKMEGSYSMPMATGVLPELTLTKLS